MIETILNSKLGQTLGVSMVFIGLFYLSWKQMNHRVDGQIEALSSRVDDMSTQNEFFRKYAEEEQQHRKTLFQAIEGHLSEISKGYHIRK